MEGGKLVLLFSLLSLFLRPSKAQFFGLGLPPCVPVLSPCLSYLRSDAPPPSCCIPLENALEDQGDCLCAAFKNKILLDKIKMTQDEMLKFPGKCGLSLPENANCSAAVSSQKVSSAPSEAPTTAKAAEPTPSPPSDESGANGKSLESLTMLFLAVIFPVIAAFHV